jgi:transposase InsO family protein
MRTELVEDALEAALADRASLRGAIFHADHGPQYTFRALAQLCGQLGGVQSLGGVGSSGDNALAESFNATLKRETLAGAAAVSPTRPRVAGRSSAGRCTTTPAGATPTCVIRPRTPTRTSASYPDGSRVVKHTPCPRSADKAPARLSPSSEASAAWTLPEG